MTNLFLLQKALKNLEIEAKKLQDEEDEFRKKEKKTPWNVDTISKPGFEKTLLNKPAPRSAETLSEEEREKRSKKFMKDNEALLKQFGMLRKYDDSKRFLMEHNHLVCEDTANYLVIWCINLEMEKKHELMSHVAHQCICMQYILELSKQLDVDPRACVSSFFAKIQNAVVEYKDQFDNEIQEFKKRIERRAEEKLQEAIAEQEEEERKARLGPGGLDPVEVFETLPEVSFFCSRNSTVIFTDFVLGAEKVLRNSRYSNVTGSHHETSRGRGTVSHETLRRFRFVGARCQRKVKRRN